MEVCRLTYGELGAALEQKAAAQETITYNDLARQLGLQKVDNLFSNHPFKAFLSNEMHGTRSNSAPFARLSLFKKQPGVPVEDSFDLSPSIVESRYRKATKIRSGSGSEKSYLRISILHVNSKRSRSS